MSHPEAYVRVIKEIKEELTRLAVLSSELRIQKKEQEKYLRKYMKKNKLEKYKDITLKSITPKRPSLIKPKDKKKEDAINMFRDQGIENPEEFWNELQISQKFQDIEEKEEFLSKTKKSGKPKSKKNGYSTSSTIFLDL